MSRMDFDSAKEDYELATNSRDKREAYDRMKSAASKAIKDSFDKLRERFSESEDE